MAQSLKIFFALLFSLFLHLVILQARFETSQSEILSYSTTEIGFVQLSTPQQAVSTLPIESSPLITHGQERASSASAQDAVKMEDLKPVVQVDGFGSRLPVAAAEDGTLSPGDARNKLTSKGQHEQKQPFAEVVDKINTIPANEKVAVAGQIVGEGVASQKMRDKKTDQGVSSIAKTVQVPTEEMPVTQPSETREAGALTQISGINTGASSLTGRDGVLEVLNAMPRYEINPRPVYPDIALLKGWEGNVMLRVDVKKNGFVERVGILKSSGFSALDRAALKVVKHWQFVPAMSAGLPVDSTAKVPINFKIPKR